MSNYSNIPLSPDDHSNLTFWCFTPPKKNEKKKCQLSLRGAFSLFCILESAIILRDDVFELTESEFLTIHSKAKSTVPKQSAAPRTKEREGGSNSPQRD